MNLNSLYLHCPRSVSAVPCVSTHLQGVMQQHLYHLGVPSRAACFLVVYMGQQFTMYDDYQICTIINPRTTCLLWLSFNLHLQLWYLVTWCDDRSVSLVKAAPLHRLVVFPVFFFFNRMLHYDSNIEVDWYNNVPQYAQKANEVARRSKSIERKRFITTSAVIYRTDMIYINLLCVNVMVHCCMNLPI